MIHEIASHVLRTLVIDRGTSLEFEALDFLLDELREARQRNGELAAKIENGRRELSDEINKNLRERERLAVAACARVAERRG